jgi:hypothetical protein
MATATKKKTASSRKPAPKAEASANADAPKIIAMKGGLTAKQLVQEALFTMEDDLRLSKAQANDFVASLQAVIDREIADGNPVNLFGYLKVIPRFHTKGKRQVYKVFGDPESGKVMKSYPAKSSLKVSILKPIKDALPAPAKLGRKAA